MEIGCRVCKEGGIAGTVRMSCKLRWSWQCWILLASASSLVLMQPGSWGSQALRLRTRPR